MIHILGRRGNRRREWVGEWRGYLGEQMGAGKGREDCGAVAGLGGVGNEG